MLHDLGLEVNPDERPINFSLGMRQRLLLGLALSHHPDIIILDEPFNGLDVDGIVLMKKILVDYVSEAHTVLITSHSLKELQDIVHAVIFMKEGKTQEKVDMAEIKKNYDGDLLQFYQESKKQGDTNE
ncbi:ATP-binding cassette domain-containing protein [Lactococcus garvieae]|nr:ATP-binding cassette domain-containing protein [Lactococcus garvieae]